MFRNLYADEVPDALDKVGAGGKEIDVLENGENSCAVFVSWILLTLELIKHPHASVFSTEKDLIASGWFQIKDLKPGAILIWEEKIGQYDGIMHQHMGFCVNDDQAISNSSQNTGFPIKHHVTYNNSRQVEKIYWHPELGEY